LNKKNSALESAFDLELPEFGQPRSRDCQVNSYQEMVKIAELYLPFFNKNFESLQMLRGVATDEIFELKDE
jgi:hypothetical protein